MDLTWHINHLYADVPLNLFFSYFEEEAKCNVIMLVWNLSFHENEISWLDDDKHVRVEFENYPTHEKKCRTKENGFTVNLTLSVALADPKLIRKSLNVHE